MSVKELARQAVIAAVYIAVSLALMPISFGPIQCRVAESMMVLPFYNKKYSFGLITGCLITNMFSELGLADVVFGAAATALVCLVAVWLGKISALKRMNQKDARNKDFWRSGILYIPFAAAVINGVIIGALLYFILGLPYIPSAVSVAIGEYIAVFVGVLAMRLIFTHDRLSGYVMS